MSEAFETVLTEIKAKLEALGQTMTDQMVRDIAKQEYEKLTDRKMHFAGGDGARRLQGSKYGRLQLSVSDIELAYDGIRAMAQAGLRKPPSEELTNAFKDVSPARYEKADDDLDVRQVPQMRAMDTAETGYGLQLVGAQYVGELWEAARAGSVIMNQLDTFEMKAPTVYMPIEVDVPEMLLLAESTASNSSNYTTAKTGSNQVSVTPKKFGIHQMWSYEMEEDSVIPFVPFLRKQAELSIQLYGDQLVLLGDTTNAGTGNLNLDDANPADTKAYLGFDGIVKAGLLDNTNNATSCGGAPSLDNILALRKLMIDRTYLHNWSHPLNAADLLFVCDPETADALAANEDDLRTIDKYGPAAVVLAGEVNRVGRHALLSTIMMSLAEADGKTSTTAGNNTLGRVVAFNKRGVKVGWRRRVLLEAEKIIGTGQARMVYSMRLGMGRYTPTAAASGIEWSAVLYNITV